MSSGDRTGELIAGRYRVIEQLDRGGQGVVYRARDERAGDEVAIKILDETRSTEPAFRERMMREAHALTVLTGTSVVRVLHQAWTDDGAFCLITELLRGKDLEDYLCDREREGSRIDLSAIARLLKPVIATLEVAHAHGILHRDLKPRNIFVLEDGSVRLLDFGFAKFMRMRGLTQAGVVAGSPSYIAPEIWKGSVEFDQRIDVYALGAIVFRALSGRPPFSGGSVQEIVKLVTTAERPSLRAQRPELAPEIDDWVRQALAIDPDERFARVHAMWAALESLAAHGGG